LLSTVSPSRAAFSRAAARAASAPDPARPFLKWAGGKRQLLPQLRRFVPPQFAQYFEPCLGSGALFFDLAASRDIAPHAAWLTDLNRDLLGCYCAVGARADDEIQRGSRVGEAALTARRPGAMTRPESGAKRSSTVASSTGPS
jgi:hypothetical protein